MDHIALESGLRCVLLRHDLSDGTWHYDWMLQRHAAAELVTFRCHDFLPDAAAWVAERIGDHRLAYLEFEGEISGGRGSVTRVAAGRCQILIDTPRVVEAVLAFDFREPVIATGHVVGHGGEPGGQAWSFVTRRFPAP